MKICCLPVFLLAVVNFVSAHEMWLQPRGQEISPFAVDIVVGQNFRGSRGVWIPTQVARAEWVSDGQRQAITARFGDIPAIQLAQVSSGDRILYHSNPEVLRYTDTEKFATFGAEKGYPGLLAAHQARALEGQIVEAYQRYAKLLVGFPLQDAQDRLKIEFVVDSDGRRARLYYQGAPLAEHQVTLFQENAQQRVLTDSEGFVALPIQAGQPVLLDAVVIEPVVPTGQRGVKKAQWRSHWASTVYTPQ